MGDDCNGDESVPHWLNKTLFLNVLDSLGYSKLTVNINNLQISFASQKGDNYASEIYRIKIHFTDMNNPENPKCIPVIAKTMPADDTVKGQQLKGSRLFESEYKMYTKIIPKLEKLWRHYGEKIKFAGNFIYAENHPHPVIVLEDLCPSGYKVLRERLFNIDEVKICLKKLAHWHAGSYKITAETETQATSALIVWIKSMQDGLMKTKGMMQTDYMGGGMTRMIRALERAKGFDAYLPKLREMKNELMERIIQVNDAFLNAVQGPIYVLNHGDFHTKNIMYRTDKNGILDDVLFIDFQMSFFGPSTYDLEYASFTLFSRELRDENREYLYHYYFKCFRECLTKLKFIGNKPIFRDLKADFKRWRHFEIYLVSVFLPFTTLNPHTENKGDIDLVFDSAEYREERYNSPDYIEYLRKLLPQFLKDGYLD